MGTAIGMASQEPFSEEGLSFFEKEVRPLLIDRCLECHGEEKQKGGLRLDARDWVLQGGDTGPAVVPGKPDQSLLLTAVRYEDPHLQMPPENPLKEAEVKILEAWIARGLPDPRKTDAPPPASTQEAIDIESGRHHWAYQLPQPADLPPEKGSQWAANEVDRFILAGLNRAGLKPNEEAKPEILLRRLSFDLLGLPPSTEELRRAESGFSPMEWEQVVDRYLNSPGFGERWGRHWLDVVRFAESVTLRGLVFKQAWRYRDYVIEAFNRDMPYNQFLREQVAGDLMGGESLEQRQRRLIATGFLVLGNTNLEEQDKEQLRMNVVDEQLDVIGKAFLAQTIACARCHDHKFDPIRAEDYYAMAGILRGTKTLVHANVSDWVERPLPLGEEKESAYREHEQRLKELQQRVDSAKKVLKEQKENLNEQPAIVASKNLPGLVLDDAEAEKEGDWQHSTYSGRYIQEGYSHDKNEEKGSKSLVFRVPLSGRNEVRLAYTHGGNRASNVPVGIRHAGGKTLKTVNETGEPPIEKRFVSLGTFDFTGEAVVEIRNDGTDGYVIVDAIQFLSDADLAELNQEQENKPDPELVRKVEAAESEVHRLEAKLSNEKGSMPPRPMVMAVKEHPVEEVGNARIHVRGNVHSLGKEVPRGFLEVAHYGERPKMPAKESGRLQLADWLASENNPLTARVMVNRVWHWLFGSGLVRTVDNFGLRGAEPSHPELLDYLALRFMEEGWSVKWLIKTLVTSQTYRMSSEEIPQSHAVDPQNRLFWRMNRKRLEAECLRDAMLSASGKLDLRMGGRTFPEAMKSDYDFEYKGARRSVYVPALRNSLPDIFEVFDFANHSLVTGKRDSSTVAPQALYLMNHPFVLEQAKATASRLMEPNESRLEERIVHGYRLVLGRLPASEEMKIAKELLGLSAELTKQEQLERWTLWTQALFASIDFRYLR